MPISLSYDLAHLTELWLDPGKNQKLAKDPLGWLDGQCVQGAGTYSPLESMSISFVRVSFPRLSWESDSFRKERLLMTSDY